MFKNIKNGLKPKNIANKIKNLPRMDQVYWTKLLSGVVAGIIFGVSNFRSWPAALTMFGLFVIISTTWFLVLRNIEPGIKIRQYYTSALFQYFITMIAIWTIILNVMHVPYADF